MTGNVLVNSLVSLNKTNKTKTYGRDTTNERTPVTTSVFVDVLNRGDGV